MPYAPNDRYRGIHNARRVVLVNPGDLEALGIADRDEVDLVSVWHDGTERRAENFRVVGYPTSPGSAASYYPRPTCWSPGQRRRHQQLPHVQGCGGPSGSGTHTRLTGTSAMAPSCSPRFVGRRRRSAARRDAGRVWRSVLPSGTSMRCCSANSSTGRPLARASLRPAAQTCFVSQPALSEAVRKLEEELDVPLVRRGRKYEGLTPEGERIVVWAQRILADRDALKKRSAPCAPG